MMRTKVQAARKAEAKQRPEPKERTRSDGSAELLHLQQAAGNRAVNLLLGEPLQRQPVEEEEAPTAPETTSTTAAGPKGEEAPAPPEATPAPPVKGTAGGEQAPMPPETTSTTAAGPKGEEAPAPPEATPAPPVKGAAGGEQAPMPPETTSTTAAGPKGEEAPAPPEATPAPPVKGTAGGEQAPMPPETTSTAAAGPKEVTSPTGGLSADARRMALGMYESMVVAKVESAHSAAAAKDAKSAYADVGAARDAALAIGKQIGPRTEATATLAATYAILQNSHTRLQPHVGEQRMPLKEIAKEMDPKSRPMESWLDGPRIALTKEGE